MKHTLQRAPALCALLALLLSLLAPPAAAIEYKGVPEIAIEAQSALLVDLDTGQLLLEQDANETRYPASITKIMTCLLTLEAIGRGEMGMDTVITIPEEALADVTDDSSTAGLLPGEEITVKDTLYCLMLASANEAANALAVAVAGSVPAFVDRMNQRAQELGMTGTHFVNPHGLHDPDHYTTAWDIYRMAKEAMTHAPFREIVSTGRYSTAPTERSESRLLLNTNGLLARYKYPGHTYAGTIGIKTGSTGQAGYCLVAAARRKGHTLVSVVLGAQNPPDKKGNPIRMQFVESRRLLDWGFTNFSAANLLDADSYLQEVPVRNSFQTRHVVLQPVSSVKTLVPGAYDPAQLDLRFHPEEETLSAPIQAGDVLGSVEVLYGGQDYGTVEMAAVNDISYSPFLAFVSGVNTVLGNLGVRIMLLAALVFVIVGVTRRYLSEQHQLRKKARLERQVIRKKEAEARREEAARQRAAYEAEREEKRRLAEENRRIREEEARERRRQKEEQEQIRRRQREEEDRLRRQEAMERKRQKEEQERRRQDRERRRREDLERRQREEQARWEAEQAGRSRDQRAWDRLPYDRGPDSRRSYERNYDDRRDYDRSYDGRGRSYDRERESRRTYDRTYPSDRRRSGYDRQGYDRQGDGRRSDRQPAGRDPRRNGGSRDRRPPRRERDIWDE